MGGKSSSSSSQNTTNNYDQRQVNSYDEHNLDLSNRSSNDYSNRSSTTVDASNRSTSTINIAGSDAAAINAQNAELLRGLGGQQSDAVKAIADMQRAGMHDLGGAFTTLAQTDAAAWSHTVDAGAELLGKITQATTASSDSARMVAQAAIASFQPADNKASDTFKYAAIAGAAVLALAMLRKG